MMMLRGMSLMGLLCAGLWSAAAVGGNEPPKPVRKPFGLERRVPWTTSKVHGSPEPPHPYRLERVFPNLKFDEPLELSAIPGANRWVVAERRGKIYTFVNDPAKAVKQLLIDVGKTVYGVVLHPRWAENGYLYVSCVLDDTKETPDGSLLVRYRLKQSDPPEADPKSETILLRWPSGGHNGGCLRFGPDGYLYLATGDGSGIADGLQTGQDLRDLLGAILRIDVDRPEAGRPYRVPPDNPFLHLRDARPEIWAYGLRQPWKFSFDTATGDLWAGEVGQDLWEMIYRIERGGNYGWSVQEGSHPFRPERPRGPTPIQPPVIEHHHTEARSITGGYVYHGRRLPELRGAYIYGDYDTGRVWMLRWDGRRVTESRELARSRIRIVAWGQDHDGEVYALDFIGSGIYRLVPSPAEPPATAFPRKLSETGLFTSTKDLRPAPGLIPYSVNAELWSDGAIKERYLAIPGDGRIEYETVTYPQPAPGAPPGWRFPDDTVLVKTFFLELEPGNPQSRRRLETRLLHLERMPGTEEIGDQVWNGYTYVWNDEQTDAELLDAKGLDRTFVIRDPKAPGGRREQVWHFPSRAECSMCHTVTAKYALGVNTLQMNRDHDYGGVIANQLATLEHLGLFTQPLPARPEQLPRLVDYRDPRQDLDARARSYLHANCSHCHRKWGGGNADFQLLATLPLDQTGIINARPGHGSFDLTDPRILVPGQPERSLIVYRMARRGLGQMPHIASNVIDQDAVELITEWVRQLPR
ncbi:MAG: PQQ-dependent sugar dehydrogenase [Gemmataceae bacterium]|nr:PQQ-dependent sugar dehydrogenase [Gemmataceae bacterium]MDW8264632.1 PQQ-dependent sugar dehydrogenase [Gemmataceae bacterium]